MCTRILMKMFNVIVIIKGIYEFHYDDAPKYWTCLKFHYLLSSGLWWRHILDSEEPQFLATVKNFRVVLHEAIILTLEQLFSSLDLL